ncbi:phospholipid/cholesterol/gamma-HCH transport system permease protein [Haloechinothrix alba]|uniref:Phospholipid/cholesterol/gamma-HCH transport system permease protein n=1 Tax=Haloechinothrix alba TaxID=664784 RepID=A0A238XP67_9PSEU|nr:ABC transporter permease [Haloechinothrix alba]SNR60472.1 phospholipid/cholesterol/gamma-HCH transport system permease protein [Haloechinothrix alba]
MSNSRSVGGASAARERINQEGNASDPLDKLAASTVSGLDTLGKIAIFGFGMFADLPFVVRHYFSEAIRQAGILVVSSSVVLWVFTLTIGLEAALLAHYILGNVGAQDYAGMFIAFAVMQATSASTFGWIFAAKVGCGYAAELGTMRITEEVDALRVMGMHPRAYLAGTRLLACLLAVPFIFVVTLTMMLAGGWVMAVQILGTTSSGGFLDVLWTFMTPLDVLLALVWSMATVVAIVVVSCYFGYNASGGPVGVGTNTARSMALNLIVASAFTGLFYQVFFGMNVAFPIAN